MSDRERDHDREDEARREDERRHRHEIDDRDEAEGDEEDFCPDCGYEGAPTENGTCPQCGAHMEPIDDDDAADGEGDDDDEHEESSADNVPGNDTLGGVADAPPSTGGEDAGGAPPSLPGFVSIGGTNVGEYGMYGVTQDTVRESINRVLAGSSPRRALQMLLSERSHHRCENCGHHHSESHCPNCGHESRHEEGRERDRRRGRDRDRDERHERRRRR